MKRLLLGLALALALYVGYRLGIAHVIYNADIFCVDYDNEAAYLEIDGEVHEYFLYIG